MQAPAMADLDARADWRAVDFIADLHLEAAAARTFTVWRDYLHRTTADAVFILGDLFEVWVGDDLAESDAFARDCAEVLSEATAHRPVYFMPGNRDFLVGPAWFARTGVRPLADPTVLHFGGRRWLLSHGDALCTGDTAYQAFRAEVRAHPWQQAFLAQPIDARLALARALRAQSAERQRALAADALAEVDAQAACAWLEAADAPVLIHGHTHRPAVHTLPCRTSSASRIVLSDWDFDAEPARGSVLRVERSGQWQRIALPL
ncbi:UDP-2,3-diacylglucosamine hydrolase [Tibeticola sediminis]|uniref:UDP-2,3-diacylglucosamine hydrolase n=1 Tax=Tibeticola sediminis TaxID=1917811 RepID=A0A3N4UYN2_9BURK|nr:UDP-2,3-diacylglucosamine diphosphatase [Tibeticola sediminis]RPE72669.1 UDP-2,3-diacylglucosamine hydrolase [Tibeticola sediminis]